MIVCAATEPNELSAALIDELHVLQAPENEAIDSSLLIHPNILRDFMHYNDYLDRCDEILEQLDLIGEFQIASFHPHYQFAGSQEHDAANYTNRSPYPMLHVLREASVTRALERHPDPDSIPAINSRRLESLGKPALEALLSGCRSSDDDR